MLEMMVFFSSAPSLPRRAVTSSMAAWTMRRARSGFLTGEYAWPLAT